MNGKGTGRKRTGDKMCWQCQYFPVTRRPSPAGAVMMRRRWTAWLFLFFVLVLSLSGCGWSKSEEFPTELIGQWVTNDPKYKGCYMVIDKESIAFNAVDNNLYVSVIEKTESDTQFGRKVYHLSYSDINNIEHVLSLIVLGGEKQGLLQFYNQRYLEWYKMDPNKGLP